MLFKNLLKYSYLNSILKQLVNVKKLGVSRNTFKPPYNKKESTNHFSQLSAPASAFILRSMSSIALESLPKVDIDRTGIFKYILLKVYDTDKEDNDITIVRGYQRCNYHSDIYDEVAEKLYPLECDPMGGGRISHDSESKKIHIYGYSQGYGKGDHELAAKLIKEVYPDYKITVSDEGY